VRAALAPTVKVSPGGDFVRVVRRERGRRKAFRFVVYVEDKDGWRYTILPASERPISLSADRRNKRADVTAVDRLGNESPFLQSGVLR
jgi:hypothetical protein